MKWGLGREVRSQHGAACTGRQDCKVLSTNPPNLYRARSGLSREDGRLRDRNPGLASCGWELDVDDPRWLPALSPRLSQGSPGTSTAPSVTVSSTPIPLLTYLSPVLCKGPQDRAGNVLLFLFVCVIWICLSACSVQGTW